MYLLLFFVPRAYYYKLELEPIIPSIQQLSEGLDVNGLIYILKKNGNQFSRFFVKKDGQLSEDSFLQLMEPLFSEPGSNKHTCEINTYKFFTDFVEDMFNNGEFVNLSFNSIQGVS